MNSVRLTSAAIALLFSVAAPAQDPLEPIATPSQRPIAKAADLSGSFTFRMCVKMSSAPATLPVLAANKAWEDGKVRDYTTNNAYGLGRESGKLAGFALSVLPDGAWTWNAGDGRLRVDHRPAPTHQHLHRLLQVRHLGCTPKRHERGKGGGERRERVGRGLM